MRIAKQRRDALLIAPADLMIVNDRRGRPWVTDRFVLVRADLFKQPPTEPRGVFVAGGRDFTLRGQRAVRGLLRDIHFADTRILARDNDLARAVGDDKIAWFRQVSGGVGIYVAANKVVCDGYAATGLFPRLHRDKGVITWWAHANARQWALAAVMMPRNATPTPRGGAS